MSTNSTEDKTGTPPGGGQSASGSAPSAASQGSGGTEGPATQKEAVKQAYSAATTALRENHRDEFIADVKARVKDAGFEWAPRPTKEEKAREQIRALMEETGLSASDFA